MKYKILELYSGIGGMHCALKESKLPGKIVLAVDINTVANQVYKHNFTGTNVICKNIQSLSPQEIKKLEVNVILMSPPCQPFTRNGKFMDENDPRTNSFIYIISILDQLENIDYILMENVKGFECSAVRNMFVEKLKECNFVYQEFLISPSSIGIPNSRLRYYCVCKKNNIASTFTTTNQIMENLPKEYEKPYSLKNIMEPIVDEKFLMPDKFLKRANVLDVCHEDSVRSCCFTKAYSHYVEGTGSVFTNFTPEEKKNCYDEANKYDVGSEDFINTIKNLKLRYFTPNEILSIMAFPKNYNFPENITTKQCYRLLGNSVNVKVISELLNLLFECYIFFYSPLLKKKNYKAGSAAPCFNTKTLFFNQLGVWLNIFNQLPIRDRLINNVFVLTNTKTWRSGPGFSRAMFIIFFYHRIHFTIIEL